MQDCSNSIANALELLQSCTKPSKWCFYVSGITWVSPVFFSAYHLSQFATYGIYAIITLKLVSGKVQMTYVLTIVSEDIHPMPLFIVCKKHVYMHGKEGVLVFLGKQVVVNHWNISDQEVFTDFFSEITNDIWLECYLAWSEVEYLFFFNLWYTNSVIFCLCSYSTACEI